MFSKKFLSSVVIVGLLAAMLVIPSASAGGSTNASFAVSANAYPASGSRSAYINMYRIDQIQNGLYYGSLADTQYVGAGSSRHFTVPLGAMVEFVAFSNSTVANAATHWTFTSPPYKNFTMQEAWQGKLCQINFQDQYNKMMSNGSESCAFGGLSVPVSDSNVAVPASIYGQGGARAFVELWVMQNNSPSTRIKSASIDVLDANGNRIATTNTDYRGIAGLAIERGRQFTFRGYKNGVTYMVTSGLHSVSGGQLVGADGQRTSILQLNAYPQAGQVVPVPTTLPSTLGVAVEGSITAFSQTASVRYTLNQPSTVTVRVYSNSATTAPQVVRTIENGVYRSAGTQRVLWDGRDGNGTLQANGWYRVQVSAYNPVTGITLSGSAFVHVNRNRVSVASVGPISRPTTTLPVISTTSIDSDCDAVNPDSLSIEYIATSNKYKLSTNVNGRKFTFQIFPTYDEAVRARDAITTYRFNKLCFVGRGATEVNSYWLRSGGSSLTHVPSLRNEDCVSFNSRNLTLSGMTNGKYQVLDGNHALASAANYSDAMQLKNTLASHNYSQSCFVGRPAPSMHYYK
ncbi:hypothetical protein KBD59_02150 [Candidatus Gracilibacteria bacterium]|nr:hypothetical protein [Candidatus Gracilibacteria bacterium]